jgi:YD repeat-containing protein
MKTIYHNNSYLDTTYTFTYDDEDRLTRMTSPGATDTFTYNGLGLRVGTSRTAPTGRNFATSSWTSSRTSHLAERG